MTAVTVGILAAGLAGCAFPDGSGGSRESERVPVPDEVLIEAIEDIPGVTEVDVSYEESFTNGRTYGGSVEVNDTADPVCVLDNVRAILWQGREAWVIVSVVRDGVYTHRSALGDYGRPDETQASHDEMEERYGRRPKDGVFVEPETPPACR